MKNLNQSQKIIIFFSVLFLAGSVYLFSIDSRYNDPRYNEDWFALSFSDPESDSLDFMVENFSSQSGFRWEALRDGQEMGQGTVTVAPGEKKEIFFPYGKESDSRYVIRITGADGVQEIYKNIR